MGTTTKRRTATDERDLRIRDGILGVVRASGNRPVTVDELRSRVTGQNSVITRVYRDMLAEGVLRRAASGGGVRLWHDPDERKASR